ncbi:hypothetical protein BB558_005702 [Smittium angustum]|uniref:U6 small nuclear RNA (adenine-(43)-N(6))-methyltransferase n=1 Tax=Smittium angustum TaxID=133377 RepID=A0A2U1IZS4_SMIAN|nr:hypothetical protein BB558_005702 [Smittium angustum]
MDIPNTPALSYKFSSQKENIAFSTAFLKSNYNINIFLPQNHLCPTIPNRTNYIKWVSNLLLKYPLNLAEIIALDIGCGPSCIYPLLGITLNKNWSFLATDIDLNSVRIANYNISLNNMENKISTIHNTNPKTYFYPIRKNLDKSILAFSMCNPPFYSTENEKSLLSSIKTPLNRSPAVSTMSEKVTVGGEKCFLKNMIVESVAFKNRIIWFTSMVGRKDTLDHILKLLKHHNASL